MWRVRGFSTVLLVTVAAACAGAPLGATPSQGAEPSVVVAPTDPAPSPETALPETERPSASPSLCPPAPDATSGSTQVVKGVTNIFGAGHDTPPQPGGGGAGQLPPVWQLPPGVDRVVMISCAEGEVIPRRNDGITNGPGGDGYGPTDVQSFDGISGIVHAHNGMFLVGVFLTDSVPVDPAPARLDFTDGDEFADLAPEIGQVFLVGDGVGRRYAVPADATRLYLGFADGAAYQGLPGYYDNNGGQLAVTVEVSSD